ncbi:hypothetical protein AB0J21_13685 [Streptomyces sp. NPDC049954]|uniref:hypothetical protein n=1 Tax=Streptomyces sp. NPDC049954 TaxID=3155779 RepID=UPI00341CE795
MNAQRRAGHPDPAGTESAGPRPRGGLRPLATLSVVGVVLLAGGGTAAVLAAQHDGGGAGGAPAGRTSTGPASPGGSSAPPLALDAVDSPAPSAGSGSAGIAPGEPDPDGVRYRADGPLPKGPASAPVYRSSGTVARGDVLRLAKALGVEGSARAEGGDWRIGPANDGSGPALRVSRQAPGSWTYLARPGAGGDNCPRAKPCSPSPGGTPVSAAATRAAAAPVLKALGQGAARTRAERLRGAVREVEADPVLDGLPTRGWSTLLQVAPDGTVSGGSGKLLEPVKGPRYPVGSAQQALDRLNAGGPGAGTGGPSSVPVESARFGLSVRSEKGRPVLVPSWLFDVRPSGAGQLVTLAGTAVDAKYLEPGGGQRMAPGGPGSTGPGERTRAVRPQSYTADGRRLTVRFTGGVCASYRAFAHEEKGRVRVSVVEHSRPGKVCVLLAEELSRTVTLERPAGERTVVDHEGRTVPAR